MWDEFAIPPKQILLVLLTSFLHKGVTFLRMYAWIVETPRLEKPAQARQINHFRAQCFEPMLHWFKL